MSGNILESDLKQVASIISTLQLKPGALSPFGNIEPTEHPARQQADNRLEALVKIVANPAASIMVKTISSAGVGISRIYAGQDKGCFVRHIADKTGRHCFQQAAETEILRDPANKMDLDIPASSLKISADIGRDSFCALTGLIDGWRERTLLSLMERTPKSTSPYALDSIYAAYRRSISSTDLRWLTPLVRDLYPGNMDITSKAFNAALLSLGSGLVETAENGVKLTLAGEELCASMSAPLSALRITVSEIQNGIVIENTLIGVRGLAMFCTINVPNDGHSNLHLKESSFPDLELDLHGMLKEALRRHAESFRPTPPPLPADKPTQAVKFCSHCGKPVEPEMRFCANCGTKA